MRKLFYTPNTPFDLHDWEAIPLKQIYAGTNCVMAITENGRVLQKITDPDLAARCEYWTRVTQISISKWAPGFAIGLVEDGTCLISKKAVRARCDRPFEDVNNAVKSWQNIVQVEVSDAFFALDKDGHVHYTALDDYCQKDYAEALSWNKVRRIVTGPQNSLFGITEDGTVLAAGANCRQNQARFAAFSDIADVFPIGSECEDLYLVRRDGRLVTLHGDTIHPVLCGWMPTPSKALEGTFRTAYALTLDHVLLSLSDIRPVFDASISSFAVGDDCYAPPFVLALGEARESP